MSYDTWLSGIYDVYDGTYKYWEQHDEIMWLQDIIKKNNLKSELWDNDGEYKWKSKEEYEGFKYSMTTEGKSEIRRKENNEKKA